MPIRKSERARYPKDWKAIRARIMARAGNRCECRGECGAQHQDLEVARSAWRCNAEHGALILRDSGMPAFYEVHSPCGGCAGGDPDCARVVQVVLTIAHLDHTPENCADENLRAMCQRCHLVYDSALHTGNARRTRQARKAVGMLPGVEV